VSKVTSGGRLRPRLLTCAAATVLAAPLSGKALAQDAKWQPWVELGGMVGTERSFGDGDIFIPVWQDQTSLLFGDLRGRGDSQGTGEGNFGLGYRTQIDPGWILGGWGYFDIQDSKYDNTFYQATIGAEALSVDWDFRVNGYIPFNSDGHSVDGKAKLQISGNSIQLRAGEEKSLFGFDGEVGWRLPVLPADGDMDVRAFIGGYYFTNDDVDTVAGPRGRIEARLYDIDLLGLQSRLTLDGEIQWDQVRGTQALGGLELRIPLGMITGQSGPRLSPLDRRMVDRVQRDVDIVTQAGAFGHPEDVIVDGLTVKTHTIVFADAGGAGKGTKVDPIDLNAAPGLEPGKNAIIVAMGDDGPIGIAGPLQLDAGQALIGGGSKVKLTGADSGQSVTFHAPGARPTLIGNDTEAELVELAAGGQNRVTGLDLAGDFNNGIFGADMARAVITDNSIDGADPGVGDGILLANDGGAASSFIDIARNTISNMSGNGIRVASYLRGAASPGGAFSQQIEIAGNTVGNVGANGIAVSTRLYGAVATQAIAIYANHVVGAGQNGIAVTNALIADGSNRVALAQGLAIAGNAIGNSHDDGIRVESDLNPGETGGTGMEFSQALAIAANTVTDSGYKGIALRDDIAAQGESAAGSVSFLQATAIEGNRVSGSARDGIYVMNNVGSSLGPLAFSQALLVDGNSIADAGGNGIALVLNGHDADATLSQSVQVAGNIVDTVSESGISLRANLYDAHAVQSVAIEGNSITSARVNGIFVDAVLTAANDSSVSLEQSVYIAGNLLKSSSDSGIFVNDNLNASPGAAGTRIDFSQALAITANTIDGAGLGGGDGIFLFNNIFAPGQGDSGSVTFLQTAAIGGNLVANSGADGIYVVNVVDGGNSDNGSSLGPIAFSQALSLDANSVVGSAADGIHVGNSVVRYGSDAASPVSFTQSITADANSIAGAGGRGIEIRTYFGAAALSGAVQDIGVAGNVLSDVSDNGIDIVNRMPEAGGATQGVTIAGNTVTAVGHSGIDVSTVLGEANLTQALDILDNAVADAGNDGIVVGNQLSVSTGGSFVFSQSGSIAGNRITGSGIDGILLVNRVQSPAGEATIGQSLAVVGNLVDGATSPSKGYGGNAIVVQNYVGASGSLSQALTVQANTLVNGASFRGLYIKTVVYGAGGNASQSFAISGNLVSANGGDGIRIAAQVAASSGAISQSVAITGNTLDNNAAGGIDLLATAESGSVVQLGSIAGNLLANATAYRGHGIAGVATAGESGQVSQTVAVDGNMISGNAVGVYLKAGGAGAVSQSWSFTSDSIVGNTIQPASYPARGGHGLYAHNAGDFSTQVISLVSGNVITANQSDGVRFINDTGTQSATLSSNLGGGPALNTITGNGTDYFAESFGGTQIITK
jgi:hypothetical protein